MSPGAMKRGGFINVHVKRPLPESVVHMHPCSWNMPFKLLVVLRIVCVCAFLIVPITRGFRVNHLYGSLQETTYPRCLGMYMAVIRTYITS